MAQLAINLVADQALTLAMRCPVCRASLTPLDLTDPSVRRECLRCHFVVANQGGIWRALDPVREIHFRRFTTEYSILRDREGDSLGLPPAEVRSGNGWQRRIREGSISYLESKVLPLLEQRARRPLRVLDLGAGSAWLSGQFAWRGHECVAVDLLDHAVHGLGAARHYLARRPRPFACVQADMDNLPFAAGQFDVAIFSASFHFSEDYVRTLRETVRCLRHGGEVVIMDTPYFNRDESGRAMVLEQHESFQAQYGFASNSIHSREYLTDDILEGLERECGLRWRLGRPWYGLNWALRPWKAMLQGHREPSKFYLISATVDGR